MTVEIFSPDRFKLLFGSAWSTTDLAEKTESINRRLLQNEYECLKKIAPQRSARGKSYFSDHDGSISTNRRIENSPKADRKRFEEHLCIALWHLAAIWPNSSDGTIQLLDYQFPLQSTRHDRQVGNIDLLGLTQTGRIVVVEVKVPIRDEKKRGDPPVAALFQGLRYSAIVQANLAAITGEIRRRFNLQVTESQPALHILAPKDWWKRWTALASSTRRKAGNWEREFIRLVNDVEKLIGIRVECFALEVDECDLDYGIDSRRPRLRKVPRMFPVLLDKAQLFGPALIPVQRG